MHGHGAFPGLEEEVQAATDAAKNRPPVGDEEVGHAHHQQRGRWQVRAEGAEHFLEGRDHVDHDDRDHDEGHHQHGDGVGQGGLDLLLDGDRFFLVGGQAIEQGLQDAGGFTSFDEVAVQRVEVHRVLAEGLRQAGAGLHIAADVVEQLGHARVGGAARHDVEGLQQGHTGLHHRGQLAREDGDVLLLDRAPATEAAALDLLNQDALAPQGRAHQGLAAGPHFAPDELTGPVFAFPFVNLLLGFVGCSRGHGGNSVQLLGCRECVIGAAQIIRW